MINISQNIRNVCKKKIFTPALLIVIMLLILIKCPFLNVFHPTNIDNIHKVKSSDSYVNVTADTLYYSGYNLIKNSGKEYGYYYALKNGQCVFAIIPIDKTTEGVINDYKFKAKVISPNRTYEKMISAFSKDLNWNKNGLSEVTVKFVLSSADYYPLLYVVLLWIILVVLFVAIKKLIGAIMGLVNPDLYPVCTFLGRHVQKELIDEAQEELDTENYIQINSMYITENYFIDLGRAKISVIPLNEIVWCYRLGTIPLNPKIHDPEYSIHFTILSGSVIAVKHKTSDEALELVNAIRATDYNIIIGHSDAKRRQARQVINRYKKMNNE